MYDFHYNYIKKKYGPKAKLLMTDMDSLMYEIHTEDFFEDIQEDVKEKFDTSNFEKYHPSKLPRLNKKVPGMFKDEAGGKIISEFVGLRAKSYAFDMDGDEFKKCKGVKKYVVNKKITLNDYKNCLFSGRQQLRPMNVTRSYHHKVFTEQVNKIVLSADDDKRIIRPDKIKTLAHGFKRMTTEGSPGRQRKLGKTGEHRGCWQRMGVRNSYAIFIIFGCLFGHRWEVDIINKQRKEQDPSRPSSLLLENQVFLQTGYHVFLRHASALYMHADLAIHVQG